MILFDELWRALLPEFPTSTNVHACHPERSEGPAFPRDAKKMCAFTSVQNVRPGDKLLRIDALETRHASWGGIYAALHSKPGGVRHLLLERNGIQLKVPATVTEF